MSRLLVIDRDRTTAQQLGLGCLAHGISVSLADSVPEGVRVLLTTPVSVIVVDAGALRLTPGEHATLFERVAPGVPVVIAVRPDTPLDLRVACELAGFPALARPLAIEDLLAALEPAPLVAAGR